MRLAPIKMNGQRLLSFMLLILFLFIQLPVSAKSGLKPPNPSTKNEIPTQLFTTRNSIPILLYHSISTQEGNTACVPESLFREQMTYLKKNGYRTVSLDELQTLMTSKSDFPEKTVAITFDDGYKDNYEVAFPILRSLGLKATIFVVTDWTDKSPGYLTTAQLQEMQAYGVVAASHTRTHKNLRSLAPEIQQSELSGSKDALHERLSLQTNAFAYPYGCYNDTTLTIMKESGYRIAFTTIFRWAHKSDDLLELPRIIVMPNFSIPVFSSVLNNPAYENTFVGPYKPGTKEKEVNRINEGSLALSVIQRNDMYATGCKAFDNKDYDKALELADRLIEADENDYRAYDLRGIALCNTHDFLNGMKNINMALQIHPGDEQALIHKALAYKLFGYDMAAMAQWNTIAAKHKVFTSVAYTHMAEIYERNGNLPASNKYKKLAKSASKEATLLPKSK